MVVIFLPEGGFGVLWVMGIGLKFLWVMGIGLKFLWVMGTLFFYKQPVYKQQYSNLKIDKQPDTQILNA